MSASPTQLEMLRDWTCWFCHKLPDRSPQCAGEIFPVCFRCAGVQLGLAFSYVGLAVARGWRGRFPSVRMAAGCTAMMLPLMIDGLGNAMGAWNSPGWWRGLTGLGVGLSLPWLLAPLARPAGVQSGPSEKTSPARLRQLLWPAVAGAAALVWLQRGCGPFVFCALAFAAAAGWLLFFGHFILGLVRSCAGFIASRPARRRIQREVRA